MPARIVVVHNDHAILDPLADALHADGHQVVALDDPLSAWDALSSECAADVLITRIRFPTGTPHGVALARRAHANRHQIQVVFIAAPEMECYTDDLGLFLATPVGPKAVLEAVNKMLIANKAAA